MPSRHFCKMSWRRLEDVLKTLLQDVLKTSWRRLEDVWPKQIYYFWSRRLEDALKMSCEDEDERRLQDIFKMSSSRRRFAGMSAKSLINTKPVICMCSVKTLFSKFSESNVAGPYSATFQKMHSITGFFLWIFRKFLEQLFCRTFLDDCFCKYL